MRHQARQQLQRPGPQRQHAARGKEGEGRDDTPEHPHAALAFHASSVGVFAIELFCDFKGVILDIMVAIGNSQFSENGHKSNCNAGKNPKPTCGTRFPSTILYDIKTQEANVPAYDTWAKDMLLQERARYYALVQRALAGSYTWSEADTNNTAALARAFKGFAYRRSAARALNPLPLVGWVFFCNKE